jgi:aryl-alcohol dehydrogenase-like predicted oxidoreductase
MKYRILGKTNLKVSVIGIGTWQLGGEWGKDFRQDEADAMFDRCRQVGINLIDTAECYGEHTSERLVGSAIKADREKWVVATKFGHHFHGFLERTVHYEPEDVLRQLEGSLRALQTDYIDLYQFHSGDNEKFQTPGLWETLWKQMEVGKIRHLGISVSPNDNLFQVDGASDVRVGAIQVIYNRLDRKPEQGLLQSCQRQNLGVMSRVPLASGFLTGKYKPGATFDKSDVRSTHDQQKTQERLAEVEQIRNTEVPPGGDLRHSRLQGCEAGRIQRRRCRPGDGSRREFFVGGGGGEKRSARAMPATQFRFSHEGHEGTRRRKLYSCNSSMGFIRVPSCPSWLISCLLDKISRHINEARAWPATQGPDGMQKCAPRPPRRQELQGTPLALVAWAPRPCSSFEKESCTHDKILLDINEVIF